MNMKTRKVVRVAAEEFELVEAHEITKVVVEHKDRLARFNFGVYERLCW
jgi:predicted site-specific integrase-resolvase